MTDVDHRLNTAVESDGKDESVTVERRWLVIMGANGGDVLRYSTSTDGGVARDVGESRGLTHQNSRREYILTTFVQELGQHVAGPIRNRLR